MDALTKKVKASTIVETIVAMVIIMICTGIGLTLFSNISRDVNDQLRIEAEIRCNSLATETKMRGDFSEKTVESENLRLQQSINAYSSNTHVKVLLIEAYSLSGRKICEYKELITITAHTVKPQTDE